LPFDITEVSGDDVLSKVVRQSTEHPYATVLLYSTDAFFEQHAQVIGSNSAIANLSGTAASSEQENPVAEALHSAFHRLLTSRLGAKEMPAPTFGPILHRWSSAFPQGNASDSDPSALVLPEAHVAFAGDFLAPPYGCVETSISSGVIAAQQVFRLQTAKLFVDLINRRDREGLLAVLANECDMFGNAASKESTDSFFDMHLDMHFEMTSQPKLAHGDPQTVEFGCLQSSKEGDKKIHTEMFLTFEDAGALIQRIGYVKSSPESSIHDAANSQL